MVKSVIGWLGLKLKLHHSWTFSQPITTSFWTQGDLKTNFLNPNHLIHSPHLTHTSLSLTLTLTLTVSKSLSLSIFFPSHPHGLYSASHPHGLCFSSLFLCFCVCVCVCVYFFPPLVALPLALTLCALCFGGFIRY